MPTLAAILDAILQVLALVTGIKAALFPVAVEHSPYSIETISANAANTVNNPFYGNAALLAAISGVTGGSQGSILAAIGNLATQEQANTAAILTAIGSGGGGGGGGGISAADVWNYPMLTGIGATASGNMISMAQFVFQISNYSLLTRLDTPYFWLLMSWSQPATSVMTPTAPNVSESTILASDTVLSWLTREAPTFSWTTSLIPDHVSAPVSSPSAIWVCKFGPADFDVLKAGLFPASGAVGPPVWPGASHVTLGSAVALSTGLTITAAMDGIIVTITSVPVTTSFFQFDDVKSWRYIGGLSFFDDDGHQEFPQGLGFQTAVYSPKEMLHASGVKVRTQPGIVGTVQPWTIT